jgi:hypothetical protein
MMDITDFVLSFVVSVDPNHFFGYLHCVAVGYVTGI